MKLERTLIKRTALVLSALVFIMQLKMPLVALAAENEEPVNVNAELEEAIEQAEIEPEDGTMDISTDEDAESFEAESAPDLSEPEEDISIATTNESSEDFTGSTVSRTEDALDDTKSEPEEATPSEETSEVEEYDIEIEEPRYELPLPEMDGYIFVEWNTKEDGTGESFKAGDKIVIRDDMELYAIWKEDLSKDPKWATPDDAIYNEPEDIYADGDIVDDVTEPDDVPAADDTNEEPPAETNEQAEEITLRKEDDEDPAEAEPEMQDINIQIKKEEDAADIPADPEQEEVCE